MVRLMELEILDKIDFLPIADLIKNNEIYRSIAILQFGEDVIKVG